MNDFTQWMVDQVPVFDEMIMAQIRPEDGWDVWLGNPVLGLQPLWWKKREEVRVRVEGCGYKLSRMVKPAALGEPLERTMDRFAGVWPNVTQAWTKPKYLEAAGAIKRNRLESLGEEGA